MQSSMNRLDYSFPVHQQKEISLRTPPAVQYTPSIAPYTASATEGWRTIYRTPARRLEKHICDKKQPVFLTYDPRIGMSKSTVSIFLSRSRAERFAELREMQNECQMIVQAYSCSQCDGLDWWVSMWND